MLKLPSNCRPFGYAVADLCPKVDGRQLSVAYVLLFDIDG